MSLRQSNLSFLVGSMRVSAHHGNLLINSVHRPNETLFVDGADLDDLIAALSFIRERERAVGIAPKRRNTKKGVRNE